MMYTPQVALVCVVMMLWSAPNASIGQLIEVDLNKGFIYSTPIYCSAAVPSYFNCKPSACYWSGSRSECCMYKDKTASGTTFDQCKCSSKVSCPVTTTTTATTTSTTTTPTTTPKAYYANEPLYCTANVQADAYKLCERQDSCFYSTTRSKCCSRLSGKDVTIPLSDDPQDVLKFWGVEPQCFCSGEVQCL
ncbi:uncharacterized protein LOC131944385 [Physella acuta]|uniref:uncharacterized protein LOC131944385 n=1 Tax=Physella acuta TaxID=109671 RepID=UPI0027DD54F1|nr:uncharacterized protein LOC131944385 [Physella acuta]